MQVGSKAYVSVRGTNALADSPFWVKVISIQDGLAAVEAKGPKGKAALAKAGLTFGVVPVGALNETQDKARMALKAFKLSDACALVNSLEEQLLELESKLDLARETVSDLGDDSSCDDLEHCDDIGGNFPY